MRLYAISWVNGDLTFAWAATRAEVELLVDDQWGDMTDKGVAVRPVPRGGIDIEFDATTGKMSLTDYDLDLGDVFDWHRTLRKLPGAPLRLLPGGKGRKRRK